MPMTYCIIDKIKLNLLQDRYILKDPTKLKTTAFNYTHWLIIYQLFVEGFYRGRDPGGYDCHNRSTS